MLYKSLVAMLTALFGDGNDHGTELALLGMR
jgi:hypothetical protein